MKFLILIIPHNKLLTVTNVVRVFILASFFVTSCCPLNSRNYDEYKQSKNLKRETEQTAAAGGGASYPTVLQRDWDFADVLQYFRNERLVVLQIRCFFGDGPCDLVGKWAKDRIIPGFFGICKMCTPTQNGWFDLYLNYLFDKFPDLVRAAMVKYFLSLGIKVADDEVQMMYTTFRKRRYGEFVIERINLD